MAPASTQIINGAVKILQGFIFLVKLIKVPYWYRHTRTTTPPNQQPPISRANILNIGVLPTEKKEYAFVLWELLVLFPRK